MLPLPITLASASEPPHFLGEVAALVVGAALIGFLSSRLRVVPIVGFLLAGVLIGPNALGLVESQDVVDAAAEIGVILLLFSIGIEFSLDRLARIRRLILLGGGLQVVASAGAVTGLMAAFGGPWKPALFTGFLVALSSTAIVLKLLGDDGETGSPRGQLALAMLIFQDLAVVLMVLLVPILGGSGGSPLDLAEALGKAVGIIALVLVVARRAMPALLEVVARTCSPEVFLLSVIAICFGTAYLTSLAGVSVSLGAFLAGLVVSESRHSEHAFGEILPLQILFSATFFVSVGMLLDVGFLADEPLLVLGAVAGVVAVKALAAAGAGLLVGAGAAPAAATALLLAQVGEFSFVLARAGADEGLFPLDRGAEGTQAFIAATVLLMVATPWLGRAGRALAGRMPARRAAEHVPDTPESLSGHVILAGYGDAARRLVPDLRATTTPFVVMTLNPDGAAEAEADGMTVIRGDYAREHLLESAGVKEARMVVIGDDEPGMALRVAAAARRLAPGAVVVVRSPGPVDLEALHEAGVDKVVSPAHAADLVLSWTVLAELRPGVSLLLAAGDSQGGTQARTTVDTTRLVTFAAAPGTACAHLAAARPVLPSAKGCEDCLRLGTVWVHLRGCLTCGHVGCCDTSPHRHARAHYEETGHPLIRSLEPGEGWAWCFLDERLLEP